MGTRRKVELAMAFKSVFCDSFDHYAIGNLFQKWAGAANNSSINTTVGARTGLGCLELTQDAFAIGGFVNGPITRNLGQQPNVIAAFAYQPSIAPIGTICNFLDQSAGDSQCFAQLNGDGSVSVVNHYVGQPGPLLLSTPAGLVRNGVWNTIAIGIIFSNSGTVIIWINGVLVASVSGVNTIHSGNNYCDGVQLSGPGTSLDSQAYFDDFFVGISTTPASLQDDYPGALRIYPYIPAVNKTPLQWTPLANTNWQETSQIPPPGDSAYVSSATVGNIDQYEMQPISGQGPTGVFTIAFGQTVISARLDTAGAGSVAPNIAGTEGAASALTTSYSMYTECFDDNPVTSMPFAPSDFTTSTFMGPQVAS